MSDISFKISVVPNLHGLGMAFANLRLVEYLKQETMRLAFAVERFAKQLTPVDTGRLRASINTRPLGWGSGAVVKTGTDYALYVHEGTRKMKARPFMVQGASYALQFTRNEIGARLDREITNQFKHL